VVTESSTPASDQFNLRFGGTQRLYGKAGVEKLRAAHVCVVGIGGVGSWAAEALARTAIGEITLIDLDDICTTNINRQIHALTSTVGKLKVEVMAERILQINPDCKVNLIDDFYTSDNPSDYINKSMNWVVDAIDSAPTKAALIAYCRSNKIRVIATGAAGGLIDPTRLQVVDLSRTPNDPLARNVSSLLERQFGYDPKRRRGFRVPCVSSDEQAVYPKPDGSVCQQKSVMDEGTRLDCAGGFGSSTMVTATFGFIAAATVVDKIVTKE